MNEAEESDKQGVFHVLGMYFVEYSVVERGLTEFQLFLKTF
jgi:hypothetical protein